MKIRNFADVKVNIKTEDILKTNLIYKLTFPNGKCYIAVKLAKSLNVGCSKIDAVCRGETPTAGGYIWKYKE